MFSRVRGSVIQAFLGTEAAKRRAHSVLRKLTGRRSARLYYRVDDPYSHLLVQLLPPLVERHGVSLEFVVVPEPSAATNPEPALCDQYSKRDAEVLADRHGLHFNWTGEPLPADRVRRIQAVLLRPRPAAEQLELARELGTALWENDGTSLAQIVDQAGAIAGDQVGPQLERNHRRLERAGHYLSAMVHYGGQWYWGVDRFSYLEARLAQEDSVADEPSLLQVLPPSERSLEQSLPSLPKPVPLHVYYSFRSPYSYLAVAQLRDLRERYPIELKIKPVLPMVMRGLPVPLAKRLYMVRDTKREADRLGIPFGRLCDPLKGGIGRCFATFVLAKQQGLELEFSESVTRGIWAEARDIAADSDLRFVAERAGLRWADVEQALTDRSWKAFGQTHRDELQSLGLWGVPSFRLGEYATWGRDRLPIIEDRLQQHCKRSSAKPAIVAESAAAKT